MGKILIYYKYIDIANPEALVKEQRDLCQLLGLKGRILIAHEGINATVGGTDEAAQKYKAYLATHTLFSDVDVKESDGEADHFPRLKVLVKKQIVNFGIFPELSIPRDAGRYLSPEEVHALLDEDPEDLVILDARNNYEWRVGRFDKALNPDINNFRDLPTYIDSHAEIFKGKRVLMYCTSGIRCEPATAYLNKKEVAKEIYHIKGGIQRYAEAFPDGHFRGKNYVFDGRVTQPITEDILASCDQCGCTYDDYSNCINAECNKQIIVCPPCIETYHNTCSERCKELVVEKRVNIRTLPHKILIQRTGT